MRTDVPRIPFDLTTTHHMHLNVDGADATHRHISAVLLVNSDGREVGRVRLEVPLAWTVAMTSEEALHLLRGGGAPGAVCRLT